MSKKEKLQENSYTNFIPEVKNINFLQSFEEKGTEWVGLELSVILAQTVGRFNM